MKRIDSELLSAFLDGELEPPFSEAIGESIERDPRSAEEYSQFADIRSRLTPVPEAQIEASAVRSWAAIRRRLQVGTLSHQSVIRIPVSAIAAAALTVVALGAALLWSLFLRPSADQFLADNKNVDVTIQVADGDMEHVLNWLAEHDMLREVTIALPEQQFRIVGEPVLVKPARFMGQPAQ